MFRKYKKLKIMGLLTCVVSIIFLFNVTKENISAQMPTTQEVTDFYVTPTNASTFEQLYGYIEYDNVNGTTPTNKTDTFFFTDNENKFVFVKVKNTTNHVLICGCTPEFRQTNPTEITIPAKLNKDGLEYDVVGLLNGWYNSFRGYSRQLIKCPGFAEMPSLETITFEPNTLFQYIFSFSRNESDYSLGALQETNVKTLEIPNTVTYIGYIHNQIIDINITNVASEIRSPSNFFKKSPIENIVFDPIHACTFSPYTFNYASNLASETPFVMRDKYIFNDAAQFQHTSFAAGITFEEGFSQERLPSNLLYDTGITSFTFPDCVKTVSFQMFYNCKNLETVNFSNIEVIESDAFAYTGLTSMVTPDSLLEIKSHAFRHMEHLKNIEINGQDSLIIGDETITNSPNVQSIRINAQITKIPNKFFYHNNSDNYYNYSLSKINLPDSVQSIGESAFDHCAALQTFVCPESLVSIGNEAFAQSGLKSVVLNNRLKSIGTSAFMLNPISNINFENTQLTNIGPSAFDRIEVTSITFPETIETIGTSCFRDTDKLIEVTFPVNAPLTEIPDYCFTESSLSKIQFPNNLTSIGQQAFSLTNLTHITLPETIETLKWSCFASTTNLIEVIIPENAPLTYIPEACFESSNLNTIHLPNKLSSIGNSAFRRSKIKHIYFNDNIELKTIGRQAFEESSLSELDFTKFRHLTSIGESAFKTTLLSSIVLPNSITNIGRYAFTNLSSLETLSFEDNSVLAAIPEYFVNDGGSYKANITLPNSIKTISSYAFGSANSYTFSDNTTLNSIGEIPFIVVPNYIYNFPATQLTIKKLVSTNANERLLKKITFSENSIVETIWNSFFYVESIEFPESLKYLYYTAYYNDYQSWYQSGHSKHGQYVGTKLDLKNIEYIGPKIDGVESSYETLINNNLVTFFYDAPNLVEFSAPKLKHFQGFYNMPRTINFRESAPNLKVFIGGFNCSEGDMRKWLPDGMTFVGGACNANMDNKDKLFYLPLTETYCFIRAWSDESYSEKNNISRRDATIVIPNGLSTITSYQGTMCRGLDYHYVSYDYFGSNNHELNFLVLEDCTSLSTRTWSNLSNDGNDLKQYNIYTTTNAMYDMLKNELDSYEDTDVRKIEIDVRKRATTINAIMEPATNGANITVTLNGDFKSVSGKFKVFNTSSNGEAVLISTTTADTNTVTVFVPNSAIPLGNSSYLVEYESDDLKTLNSSMEVTYQKDAVPVDLTLSSNFDESTQTFAINSQITATDNIVTGILRLYWVNPSTGFQELIKTTNVNELNNTLNANISIDDDCITNGTNTYRITFETGDPNTFQSTSKSINVEVTGQDVGLDATLSESNGGYNLAVDIDANALNYGELKICLGENQLGKQLNKDNAQDIFISPRLLKPGTNYITIGYNTESARYIPAEITKTVEYNPTVSTIDFEITPDEENGIINLSVALTNTDLSNFEGTLALYLGSDENGQLIKSTNEKELHTSLAIESLEFGDNAFYVEWLPSNFISSFVSASDSYYLKGAPVIILGATTNQGDKISITAQAISGGEIIDPAGLTIYQGTSEYGERLEAIIDDTNKTITAHVNKTDLFVGKNLFYITYTPTTGVFEPTSKTVSFSMAADGSQIEETPPITPEDLEKITESIVDLSGALDINIAKIITVLNENFNLISSDLENLNTTLEALVNKEYPTIPDYTENLDELLEAVNGLSQAITDSATDTTNIETILTSLSDKMDSANESQATIAEALEKLQVLDNISSTLDEIKTELNAGNTNSESIVEKLNSIATAMETLTAKEIGVDLTNIEKSLSDIVTSMATSDTTSKETKEILGAIKDVLLTLNNTVTNNSDAITEAINKISTAEIERLLGELIEAINNKESVDLSNLENLLSNLVDTIENGNNNVTIDTSNIEELLKELVAATANSSISIDTSNIEKFLEQIASNKFDTTKLEEMLEKIHESIAKNDLQNVGNYLKDLNNLIKNLSDSSAMDIAKINETLKELSSAVVNSSTIDNLSGIERYLKNLQETLEDKMLDSSAIETMIKDIIENTSSDVDLSQLESLLKEMNINLQAIADAQPEIDLSGIQNALNYIADKEDKTEAVVNSINNLKDAVVNNNSDKTIDTAGIEKQLEQLVEETKNDKIIFDTSNLEKALQELKESNSNNGYEKIDTLFDNLQSILSQNQQEMKGLQDSMSQLIDEMRQNSSNAVDPVELLTALDRISRVLDEGNDVGVNKETMEGILTSLNNIDSALKNNTLKEEDLSKIILAIENLKIELPEPDELTKRFSNMDNSLDKISKGIDNLISKDPGISIKNSINALIIVIIVISSIFITVIIVISTIIIKQEKESKTELLEVIKYLSGYETDSDSDNNQ